ncbi:hypothetical protein BDN70DRAFT_880005 [Pholiota conissans]|uniref:tRNA (guanine(9)-N1)-methyltransferase n=1 Tax=Pholiota conissans TaxID=109636 RepID=A0A9P6CTG6_9AGAR|nr:hypothetical protein BDN70DRAFT_880005 [Pholiota conissans]
MDESSTVESIVELPTQVDAPSLDDSQAEKKPLSKNAQKKAAKAERFASLKLERRAREKEAKKEKKRQRVEKRAAGELADSEDEEKKRQAKKRKVEFGGRVVVDLGFDGMMNDKEIISLCSQLAYTHSANRNASFPFSLIFTSLDGRTHKRLESLGDASYKRWANTTWMSESYENLWKEHPPFPTPGTEGLATNPPGATSADTGAVEGIDSAPAPVMVEEVPASFSSSPRISQNTIVYLTADTEDELTELRPDETYIIGGICDHNRYKNLCLNKANESGIRTARLPIGRYLASLPTRKVLTVNQVFEILVKWVETKNWEESLYSVIPKRKFHQGGKGNHDTNIDLVAVEGDADDGEGDEGEQNGTP